MTRWLPPKIALALLSALLVGVGAGCGTTTRCAPDLCKNAGTCTEGTDTFVCTCAAGYDGLTCENNIDDCSPNPCQNGGACEDGVDSFTCTCAPGFTGAICNNNVNDCSPNPCQNGGTCADGANSFTCTCAAGYSGATCSTNINECNPNPCQNGGSCTDGINSFTCACLTGFSDATCSTYTVAADTNLSSTNTGSRTCMDGGDMVKYSVTALTATTATLDATPSAGCLSNGDTVLLINLQGIAGSTANVGNYETLTVSSITDETVTFTAAKLRSYGDTAGTDTNLGTARTNQRVMLMRVPVYRNLIVDAGVTLFADQWNGVTGGVFAIRATGTCTVSGSINMDGAGYAGGSQITVVNFGGQQGESIAGLGAEAVGPTAAQNANGGGGGAGAGDNNDAGCQSYGVSGAGAGYGTAGGASTDGICGGLGGATYGGSFSSQLFLGSGGGSGGTDNVLSDNPPGGSGGSGGGIVLIDTSGLVASTFSAAGTAGEGDQDMSCPGGGASTTSCWDFSGPGGGGSGGSVLVAYKTQTSAPTMSIDGGIGGKGTSSSAGNGGAGRSEAQLAP